MKVARTKKQRCPKCCNRLVRAVRPRVKDVLMCPKCSCIVVVTKKGLRRATDLEILSFPPEIQGLIHAVHELEDHR